MNETNSKEITEIKIYSDIEKITMENLIKWIDNNYLKKIPEDIIDNMESFKTGGILISQIANNYVYLTSLLAYTKAAVRTAKRQGKESKELYEDLIDKRDYLDETLSALKLQRDAISRNVTMRQQIFTELHMNN